jgi:hypothetical protein
MSVDKINGRENAPLRTFATWAATLLMTFVSVVGVWLLVRAFFTNGELYTKLLSDHVRAVVGVPMSAASAFCVLLVLEARGGAIEFEALGFRFRGASGPAVIWIFAFLVFAGVIRLLW